MFKPQEVTVESANQWALEKGSPLLKELLALGYENWVRAFVEEYVEVEGNGEYEIDFYGLFRARDLRPVDPLPTMAQIERAKKIDGRIQIAQRDVYGVEFYDDERSATICVVGKILDFAIVSYQR